MSHRAEKHEGEFHALQTFRGYTGCTIGISPQRSTSHECFQKAVQASFDEVLASKVKFLFSDSPERIFRAARRMFPSLIAVGEDPVHLPIRMEYCSGGKITKASLRLRQLHLKFRVASSSVTRFWQPDDNHLILSAWPDTLPHETRTPLMVLLPKLCSKMVLPGGITRGCKIHQGYLPG